MLVREVEHVFRDWKNCEGRCHVSIFAGTPASSGLPVVILTEPNDNIGPSITNSIEQVAAELWRAGHKHLPMVTRRPRTAGRGIREADLTITDIPMNPVEASAVVRARARRECANTLAVWEACGKKE